MQKLSKIHLSLIGALALVGCDNVGGTSENSQIRQNKLTISNTPVFPHSGNGDVYALVLSNHTKEDMQLTNSQLKGISPSNEDSADDISSKLQLAKSLKATQLTDLIDLSACQTIKAGSNCIVTIQLPKQVASGYFDFSLQYTDSNAKAYTVDKLIVFNAEMLAKDGVVLTNQYIESIVVNSDKYTLAIPFQLTDDFESVAIRQHGVAPSGYNQIICNNQVVDEEANNSSKYAANNSCTALIELDGHEANPELGLATSDTSGLERFIEIKSSVLYGNYPELVALGAPVILRNASTQPIYIKNIGTQAAKDIQLAEAGDTASFTVSKTQCAGKTLENNQQCFVQYQAKGSNQTASITQTISYKGDDGLDTRMFSAKYPVYINKVANLKRPNQSNTIVEPPRIANNTLIEYFPEEIENMKVKFDQPINASGLYTNGGALGYKNQNNSFSPCDSIHFLSENQVSCKFKSSDLQQMIGMSKFEIIHANIKNSAGSLQNAPVELWYEYVVRHHRNPHVSAITNTSQTFKPGDTIKLAINLDSSRYSANNRYDFPIRSSRYSITGNNCNSQTNGCNIQVNYQIPPADQLPGSGSIQHTLPSNILSVVAKNNATTLTALNVVYNLTVTVIKSLFPGIAPVIAPGPGASNDGGQVTWDTNNNPNVDVPNRFQVYSKDGSNNCIKDNLTGLVWPKDPTQFAPRPMNWPSAMDKANEANQQNLCGFRSGWHLPSVNELVSLVNYTAANPSAWLNTNQFTNVQSTRYWSSSELATSPGDNAFDVRFEVGYVLTTHKVNPLRVWPVRVDQ